MRKTVFATVALALTLSACGTTPSEPAITSGRVVDKVEHDDVDTKQKVCTKEKTTTTKVNGKTRTKKTCIATKTVEVEISPEWFELKLENGNKSGWVEVSEGEFEDYDEGDQYP
jgi:ABC-type uncharacterized transport system auxiliary subunit